MFLSRRQRYIEWGDCDPAKIVFNPRYFEWFDACTAGLFDAIGWNKARLYSETDFAGFPLVESRSRFLRPSRFGETVTIETQTTDLRRSSFDIRHQLFNAGELAVEAFETRVWTTRHPEDANRLKSAPIPEAILQALKGV
ncbi:MAG: acyl-CoA thioesterase [Hyphomicrobiales bacterium]|nr:acyl-CoA thioesterase [Hyphomicrobiales bacterium]